MKRIFFLICSFIIATATVNGCSPTVLSKSEISDLAKTMSYVSVDGSIAGTKEKVLIHYEEHGKAGAKELVMIHGFGSSTITWQKCLPELAAKYHIYLIDLPGFGFSSKPEDFPYGPEGYGKIAIEFMKQKNIRKATLVGNSLGGGVSLWVTFTHQELVSELILLDSAGYPMELPSLVGLAEKQWLRPLIKPFYGKFLVKTGLKQVYYDDTLVTKDWVELYGRPFATPNAKDVPFWLFSSFDVSSLGEESKKIKTVSVPTLIIWGENDTWVPLEHAHQFNRDIKGSVLVVIPKCGHVPEEEKPEVVTKAIIEFLESR